MQTVKQYLADLKRATMHRAPDGRTVCRGGPFDGEPLALTLDGDGCTMRFRARGMSGHYRAGLSSRYMKCLAGSGNRSNGPAAWIPE
jgi:hypothetical protein